jgi:hypothetical protein
MIDRSKINRALAKAIAYKQCGKQKEAEQWAAQLLWELDLQGILSHDAKHPSAVEMAS